MNNIMVLTLLSQFHNNEKLFSEMTREDICHISIVVIVSQKVPIRYINGLEAAVNDKCIVSSLKEV